MADSSLRLQSQLMTTRVSAEQYKTFQSSSSESNDELYKLVST